MYKELLSESTLRLRWRYKQLLSKSNTYTGDINSCISNPYAGGTSLRSRYNYYNPTLVV